MRDIYEKWEIKNECVLKGSFRMHRMHISEFYKWWWGNMDSGGCVAVFLITLIKLG